MVRNKYLHMNSWHSFIARTELDSLDRDIYILIDATKTYLNIREFTTVKITEAADFDLYAEAV